MLVLNSNEDNRISYQEDYKIHLNRLFGKHYMIYSLEKANEAHNDS